MATKAALPSAVYRIHPKTGDADCAVAAMAFIFRRDPEEVLIAASKVSSTVWRSGLSCVEMTKIAKRLKIHTRWKTNFDTEDDIGVLWVSHNDTTKEHCVVLSEGWIYEVEHNPVSLWRVDEYMRANNAFGNSLLEVIE